MDRVNAIMDNDTLRFLLITVANGDVCSDIFWHSNLEFFVGCNDLFYWGVADAEPIETAADVRELDRALADCESAAGQNCDGPQLYCARRRKMRPQGACYSSISQEAWPLFDACGPVRETGLGNPSPQPEPEREP